MEQNLSLRVRVLPQGMPNRKFPRRRSCGEAAAMQGRAEASHQWHIEPHREFSPCLAVTGSILLFQTNPSKTRNGKKLISFIYIDKKFLCFAQSKAVCIQG